MSAIEQAVGLVAEVQREHRCEWSSQSPADPVIPVQHWEVECLCGWRESGFAEIQGLEEAQRAHEAHVAAEIIKALELAEERHLGHRVVDGHTDPCPAPGYRGGHTAVGAGAISEPYRCHGCGAWFTLTGRAGTPSLVRLATPWREVTP